MKTNTFTLAIGIGIVFLGVLFIWRAIFSNTGGNDTKQPIEPEPSVALVGSKWNIVTVNSVPVKSNTTPFVQFGVDGRLSGSDGCNNFSTAFSLDGKQLQVDPAMITTKMACEPVVMEQASLITELLLATTSYTMDGETLSLKQADTVGLTLVASSNSLANTTWTISSYNNGNQAVVSPILDANLTIAFATDGSVSGNAGCNSFFGKFQADAATVSIGSIGSTEMYCESPEGIMDQESAFLAALPTAATWQILGDQLWIRSAEDAIVLIAAPTEVSPW